MIVLITFIAKEASAQAIVVHGNTFTFNDYKTGVVFESISSKSVVAPNGTMYKSATFQLPEGHELIPAKGAKRIISVGLGIDYDDDGNVDVRLKDARVDIKKTGEFKISFHLNGSGGYGPKGW